VLSFLNFHSTRKQLKLACLASIVMSLSLTGCGVNSDRPLSSSSTTTGLPAGASGVVQPVTDLSAGLGWSDTDGVKDTKGPDLKVDDMGMLLVAFTAPPMTPTCYGSVKLRLWLESATGDSPVTLSSYPSAQLDASKMQPGAYIGRDNLLSNRPRTDASVANTSAWIDWDVTEIAKKWIDGSRFDGALLTPDPTSPIVVALRQPAIEGAKFTRTFTSTEGDNVHRPQIAWQAKPGCTSTAP
jgi:hypothetical protein